MPMRRINDETVKAVDMRGQQNSYYLDVTHMPSGGMLILKVSI